MALKNVKPSLNKIAKSLGEVQDAREFLLKNTREIIVLCSRSIIAVHKGDMKTGKTNPRTRRFLLEVRYTTQIGFLELQSVGAGFFGHPVGW